MNAGQEHFRLRQLHAERQAARRREIEDLPRAVRQIENELVEIEQRGIKVSRIKFLLQLLSHQPLGV